MIIQSDTRQKKKHHTLKELYFENHGIQVVHSKMLVGDYCVPGKGNVCVDTKQNIQELYQDVISDHDRFHRECVLANDCGIKLIILVENEDDINVIDDLPKWKNPRKWVWLKAKKKAEREGKRIPKPPASSEVVYKACKTMTEQYGVEFMFCTPKEAGKRVIELLEQAEN